LLSTDAARVRRDRRFGARGPLMPDDRRGDRVGGTHVSRLTSAAARLAYMLAEVLEQIPA
jgi:hypothetical protein